MRTKIALFAGSALAIAIALVALSVTISADAGMQAVAGRLALMPADADMILSVDLDALRRSPLYAKYGADKHEAILREHPELGRFVAETGLDPSRDIDSLMIASRVAEKDGRLVGLVTGRFDVDRITAKIEDEAKGEHVRREDFQGRRVFRITPPESAHHPDLAIAFLGRDAVAFGGYQGVTELIARAKSGDPGLAAARPDLVEKLDLQSQIFGAARTGDVVSHLGQAMEHPDMPPALRSLRAVQTMTFSVYVADAVEITAQAGCAKPEDATLVYDAIKGFIAMGRLAAQDHDTDLASTLEHAKLQSEGSTITFSLQIPADLLEKWHAKCEEMRKSHTPQAAPQV